MTPGLTQIIETFLLPPGILLLSIATGMLLLKHRPRTGYWLVWPALLAFYLLSIPAVANLLISGLENRWPALTEQQLTRSPAQAIVVLAGGRKANAPEYGGADTVSHLSLSRIRYAAWLYHRIHLPVITSGGIVLSSGKISEAALMTQVLQQEFDVPNVLTEGNSRTTRENARHIRKLLEQRGITQIYLVTHGFHMPRAVATFVAAGIQVIPAPTAFTGQRKKRAALLTDFLPKASALQTSHLALHEYTGMLWYKLIEMPSNLRSG